MTTPPAELQPVISRLAMIVRIVTRIVRPAVLAGLLAAVVIALALAPWLFHSTGAIVCWVVVVGVCFAAALRLAWHRRLLQHTLGSPQFIGEWYASTTQVGREHAAPLAKQLDNVLNADRGTRMGSAMRMLTSVRNLQAFKEIGSSANAVIEPIRPGRLALTGYAAIVVGIAVVLAIPILFGSLVGLALR